MVDVVFCRDSRNRLSLVFAKGHAGWADEGQDVVCAAVSAILQAARLGLEQHVRVPLAAQQKKGELLLEWPESRREDPAVQAIVATAELSIERIARQYPEHVRFQTRSGE
ncbi:MAG: ribosomal-processing cysteine protease Prp [Candidatus Meridianibacter frigidus]|nr:MAG: ribosomal-processing cysteine protease Prp [Candidatus Eremiobacteraeota bacterium]